MSKFAVLMFFGFLVFWLVPGCSTTTDTTTTTTVAGATTTTTSAGGTTTSVGATTTTTTSTTTTTFNHLSATWNIIDDLENTTTVSGQYSAIAIDSQGRAHIAHAGTHIAVETLWHTVVYPSGTWETEDVISNTVVGNSLDIVIDDSDQIYISFQDSGNDNLRVAFLSTDNMFPTFNNWTVASVATTGDVGDGQSMAIDQNNIPHVVYGDSTNSKVMHAFRHLTSGTWETEVVTTGNSLASSDLTADSSGNLCLVYPLDNGIYFTKKTGSSWSAPTAVDGPEDGNLKFSASVALDSAGKVHVAYFRDDAGSTTNYDLVHANNSNGVFEDEIVIASMLSSSQKSTAIAIDGNNNIFISANYGGTASSTSSSLHIAERLNGSWQDKQVGSSYNYLNLHGYYNDLALDSQGRIHVSFFDDNGDDLWYAVEQ